MKKPVYYILIQSRCAYNGRFPEWDWRAYRKFSAWPKTFPTSAQAQAFLDECFTFKGLPGIKLAASVARSGDVGRVLALRGLTP